MSIYIYYGVVLLLALVALQMIFVMIKIKFLGVSRSTSFLLKNFYKTTTTKSLRDKYWWMNAIEHANATGSSLNILHHNQHNDDSISHKFSYIFSF